MPALTVFERDVIRELTMLNRSLTRIHQELVKLNRSHRDPVASALGTESLQFQEPLFDPNDDSSEGEEG